MDIKGTVALVTGGASGLGRATAEALLARGARVVVVDLPGSPAIEGLGGEVAFAPADVTDEAQMEAAFAAADRFGPLRIVVHCAGRGGALRVLDKEGHAGSLAHYEMIVRINLVGSFNVLRLAAERMAKNQPAGEERGVVVLTGSVAAYEGQIGQIPYASSKAGVVGMTIVAARDLASRRIRVCTIAPGTFDTPILDRIKPEIKSALEAAVPHPSRLGRPSEFAQLALHIVENPMLNGETIRLDGALRMGPR